MISLRPEHIDAIRRHGESDYPHECCGFLIGSMDADGRKIAEEVYPISNAREETARRNRFLIAPEEFLRGEKYARGTRRDVIGIYHSHPDHPAQPSQFDLDHAWPIYSYVIVSVQRGQAAELLSWELASDRTRFNHEEISKGN